MGKHLFFRHALWVMIIALAPLSAAADDLLSPRTFTDVFGRAIKSEIVTLTDETVILKRYPDGTEFTLSLDRLSDEDRAYLTANRQKIIDRVMPLPETEFTTALRRDFRVLKKSGLALEAVPVNMWTHTRYFLVVYGLHDSPETRATFVTTAGEQIITHFSGKPVSVLWLGPANPNGFNPPPMVAGDLILAKVLPAGVAIVGVDAVRRDGALVDAEIAAIAREESPNDPALFFREFERRPEAVRAVWRKRILARIPSYWPGCVYRSLFDKRTTRGVTQAFLVDREGRLVTVNGVPLEGFFNDVVGYADKLLAQEP